MENDEIHNRKLYVYNVPKRETPNKSNEVKFIEMLISLLDLDLTYEKFLNMTDVERSAFVRNNTLKNLIK